MKLQLFLFLALSHNALYSIAPFFKIIDAKNNTAAGLVYIIPQPTDAIIANHAWDYFHASTFDIVPFLDAARAAQIPAILVIPDEYKKLSTMEERAPILEGARVALAWASTYFRFYQTDVRVLLCPPSVDPASCIAQIVALSKKNIVTRGEMHPDDQIYQRLYSYRDIMPTKTTAQLKPYAVAVQAHSTTFLHSKISSVDKKRVLITGGSGFIGSHLCRWFLDRGYHVIALDNLSCSTMQNIEKFALNPHFEFHKIDVALPFDIDGSIDIIMHLASLPSPAYYYAKPVESMVSGLNGTKTTLELAHRKNARYLLASTSEVYGDPEVHPQPEEYPGLVDPIGKRSQYDQSKRGAETLCKLYFEKYGMDIRIIRIFNTYGPGMQLGDGRVVTNFVRAALEGNAMTVYGTGEQTRSLCYISDNVDAITRIITNDEIGSLARIEQRVFNVGNPEEHTINDVAKYVNELSRKYLGHSTPVTKIPQFDQTDPKVRRPNLTRTAKQTGYTPRVSFKDGLERIFLEYFEASKQK